MKLTNTKTSGRWTKRRWWQNSVLSEEKPLQNVHTSEGSSGGGEASLSKFTTKRRLQESEYRGFITTCQQLETLKNRKIRGDSDRKHLETPAQFWKKILWAGKTRLTCEEKSVERERNGWWSEAKCIICQTWWRQRHGVGMCGCQWDGLTAVYWPCDCGEKKQDELWRVQRFTICSHSAKGCRTDRTELHSADG